MSEDYNKISDQISVYKTDKKLVALRDKLNYATVEKYAQIHAGGEKGDDGLRSYSNIAITILDYTSGTGDKTKQAHGNLSPDEVQYIYSRCFNGTQEFEHHTDKIYGEPDDNGRSKVTKLTIRRATVGSDGQPRKYPWYIEIENGTGIPARTAKGGTYCQGGSFKSESKIFINLADFDFFKLFNAANRYITVWENFYGAGLLDMRDKAESTY